MEKLLENLDKMVLKWIFKLSNEDIKEAEEVLNFKFPEKDKKYVKAYNNANSENIIFKINNEIFDIEVLNFSNEDDMILFNNKYFRKISERYFKNKKLIEIMYFHKLLKTEKLENREIKYEKNGYICYDFTMNKENPEIFSIFFEQKITTGDIYKTEIFSESVMGERIGNSLKDILMYLYIIDKKINKPTVFWIFKELISQEEIDEFQKENEIKFPEKYQELLNTARKEEVKFYPSKFNKRVSKFVIETGMYIDFKNVKETYEIFLEEHKPYPKKLIPIKLCGNGDYICLDYRGKLNTTLKEPKITYYAHDEIGNRRFIHLADSYDEFLDMIEIDEEEIERREKEIEESYFYGEQPLEDD